MNWSKSAFFMSEVSLARISREGNSPSSKNRFSILFAKLSNPYVKSSLSIGGDLAKNDLIFSKLWLDCESRLVTEDFLVGMLLKLLFSSSVTSSSSSSCLKDSDNLYSDSSRFRLRKVLCLSSWYILSASSGSAIRSSSSISMPSKAQIEFCADA